MAAKAIFVLCAQAFLIQTALAQCFNRGGPMALGPYGQKSPFSPAPTPCSPMASPLSMGNRNWASKNLALDPRAPKTLGCATPAMEITATSGGSLPVTSASAIAPTGISVVSENAYEGALSVAGEVPFVGTTGVDGVLPTAGAGATNYGCGDGVTAMVSEVISPAAAISPAVVSPTAAIASAPIASSSSKFGGCGRGLMY